MAIKPVLVPLLGTAVAFGFAALAVARRSAHARLGFRGNRAHFELDPVGPDEGIAEALDLPHDMNARTEAEALSSVGANWPLTPSSPRLDDALDADVPGQFRHDVSSLQGEHAIAPDDIAVGEELVDPGAVEVPIGHSADKEYDFRLSQNKLPQPDTTGASLLEPAERRGFSEIESLADLDLDFDDLDEVTVSENELTVDLLDQPRASEDAYDALLPEDMGTEWLVRATEAPSIAEPDALDDLAEIPVEVDLGLSPAVSEASGHAALPNDEDERRRSPLQNDDDAVPQDVWDAFAESKH